MQNKSLRTRLEEVEDALATRKQREAREAHLNGNDALHDMHQSTPSATLFWLIGPSQQLYLFHLHPFPLCSSKEIT